MEYPATRSLFFLHDKSLRFAGLPRDIRIYVLRPYLGWSVAPELCGERKLHPQQLIYSKPLPPFPGTFVSKILVLTDGAILLVAYKDTSLYICRTHPFDREKARWNQWTSPDKYQIMYDNCTDTLYLACLRVPSNRSWAYVVPYVSQMKSTEEITFAISSAKMVRIFLPRMFRDNRWGGYLITWEGDRLSWFRYSTEK